MSRSLLYWPAAASLIELYRAEYFIAYFLYQILLLFSIGTSLSIRFAAAVWIPQPPLFTRTTLWLLVALPLLLFYTIPLVRNLDSFVSLWTLSGDPSVDQQIVPTFNRIWKALPYGANWDGVILSSLTAFTGPIYEEVFFSGFLANIVLRRLGTIAALLVVPACFMLSHTLQFGWGWHILPLYFAGLTYLTIRLTTGSILWSIFAHLTANFIVFLPKWAFALYCFRATH